MRDPDNVDARGRPQALHQTINLDESRTIQSDSVEADIQTVLRRHGVTGLTEHLNEAQLIYGDVSDFTDYADAMRQVRQAETAFMKLPSKVREVFGHDAANWLDAANDGITTSQRDKLVELGFMEEVMDAIVDPAEAGPTIGEGPPPAEPPPE